MVATFQGMGVLEGTVFELDGEKEYRIEAMVQLAGLLLGPIALVAVAGMPLQSQIDDLDKQYPDARKYPS